MSYIFGTLTVLAIAGIAVLVLKYYNPIEERKKKKLNEKTGAEKAGVKKSAEPVKAKKEESEEMWLGLIKMNPKNPLPYKKLGDYYARNNQVEYAVQAWEHALKLDPKDKALGERIREIQEA